MSGASNSPARVAAAKPTLWQNPILLFSIMGALLVFTGFAQSWLLALTILQLCIISAIMTLGVNVQWGYAGLFNAGTMGFVALGGLAAVLVAADPVPEAWVAGGSGIGLSALIICTTIAAVVLARAYLKGLARFLATVIFLIVGYIVFGQVFGLPPMPSRRWTRRNRAISAAWAFPS